jgi:hypothetical protein
VLNQLEASGLTWEWVNDESLQCATLDRQNQIDIRGNRYQALLLLDNEVMELLTAKHINELSAQGMNIASFGQIPVRQPSFLNWAINDSLTAQYIREAVFVETGRAPSLQNWINQLNHPVRFNAQYTFLRHIKREMNDGSRIQFLWNKSGEWQSISLTLDEKYKYTYWLDAETGEVLAAGENRNVSCLLPPYNSVILYAGTGRDGARPVFTDVDADADTDVAFRCKDVAHHVSTIPNWDLRVDTVSRHDTPLFDWKSDSLLKYSSAEGLYKSTFHLKEIDPSSAYFLDMGKVCYTAEVKVNGQFAGRRIYEPYCLNITSLLKAGENTIEISVTPGQLNAFIGEAAHGNPLYKAFKGKESDLMSAGLEGPVRILQYIIH